MDGIASVSESHQSIVRLGHHDDSEPIFDTSISPVANFHNCERLHQDVPQKVSHICIAVFLIHPRAKFSYIIALVCRLSKDDTLVTKIILFIL